jgi:BolA protein
MSVQQGIEQKLADQLTLEHMTVENESHMHSRGTDSHFKLTLISEQFEGLRPVQRHQKIYGILADDLAAGVHALAIHAYTKEEWQARHGEVPVSPSCLGGSKHDM